MEIAEIKEILKKTRRLAAYKKSIEQECAGFARAKTLSCNYEKICISGGMKTDKVARIAEQLEKLHEEYIKAWEEELENFNKISAAINMLPRELRYIIDERYKKGKTHRQIANELYCDHSAVARKEDKAIKKISEFYKSEKVATNSTNFMV